MYRWTGTLLVALLVAVPLAAEDKKTDDKKNDREQQFKELKASFEKARQVALKDYQAAKTEEDKKAAVEKYLKPGDQPAKVLKLIEADPKDDLAFRMLAWEFQATQGQEPKVLDLLAEHHLKNPAIVDLCRVLSQTRSPDAAKFLQKVLDDSEEKSAKGCACYALAQLADSETSNDPSKAEKLYA